MVIWLSDRSDAATSFAKRSLLMRDGTGNAIDGAPKACASSGLQRVYAGDDAARIFGVARGDARVPDLFGVAQYGTVYTGSKGKIAEHGGAGAQDASVPLVDAGSGVGHARITRSPVRTTQIAPTILGLLGLDPDALQAVGLEHTPSLAALNRRAAGALAREDVAAESARASRAPSPDRGVGADRSAVLPASTVSSPRTSR